MCPHCGHRYGCRRCRGGFCKICCSTVTTPGLCGIHNYVRPPRSNTTVTTVTAPEPVIIIEEEDSDNDVVITTGPVVPEELRRTQEEPRPHTPPPPPPRHYPLRISTISMQPSQLQRETYRTLDTDDGPVTPDDDLFEEETRLALERSMEPIFLPEIDMSVSNEEPVSPRTMEMRRTAALERQSQYQEELSRVQIESSKRFLSEEEMGNVQPKSKKTKVSPETEEGEMIWYDSEIVQEIKENLDGVRQDFIRQTSELSNTKTRLRETTEKVESHENCINCPICMDTKKDTVIPCGHAFCNACITGYKADWVRSRVRTPFNCPVCRRSYGTTITMVNREAKFIKLYL